MDETCAICGFTTSAMLNITTSEETDYCYTFKTLQSATNETSVSGDLSMELFPTIISTENAMAMENGLTITVPVPELDNTENELTEFEKKREKFMKLLEQENREPRRQSRGSPSRGHQRSKSADHQQRTTVDKHFKNTLRSSIMLVLIVGTVAQCFAYLLSYYL